MYYISTIELFNFDILLDKLKVVYKSNWDDDITVAIFDMIFREFSCKSLEEAPQASSIIDTL